jgi:hypothetical protein
MINYKEVNKDNLFTLNHCYCVLRGDRWAHVHTELLTAQEIQEVIARLREEITERLGTISALVKLIPYCPKTSSPWSIFEKDLNPATMELTDRIES